MRTTVPKVVKIVAVRAECGLNIIKTTKLDRSDDWRICRKSMELLTVLFVVVATFVLTAALTAAFLRPTTTFEQELAAQSARAAAADPKKKKTKEASTWAVLVLNL